MSHNPQSYNPQSHNPQSYNPQEYNPQEYNSQQHSQASPPQGYPPPYPFAQERPSGYGQGYLQPYSPHAYPQSGGHAAQQTNTMAILALVFAFLCWPLAIVFGHIAHKQITRTGEGGRGLATAGLILGYLALLLTVLTVVAFVALIGAIASYNPYG